MVNDVPMEARLYPAKWKQLDLRQHPMKKTIAQASPPPHAPVGELFDESASVILEAEKADRRSKRFIDAYGVLVQGYPLITDPAAEPLSLGWRLPATVKPGTYELWLCWRTHISDGRIAFKVGLGTDSDRIRETLPPVELLDGFTKKQEWRKCFVVEIKEGDRYLHLEPSFKDGSVGTGSGLFFDAIALTPANRR
jgi:hypothetical protein